MRRFFSHTDASARTGLSRAEVVVVAGLASLLFVLAVSMVLYQREWSRRMDLMDRFRKIGVGFRTQQDVDPGKR